MEMHLLEKIVAVAEELHFGRAALRLHISQPPLSQAVQRLEREMGVTLLERDRRNVALTEAGRAFLEESRNALEAVRRGACKARQAAEGATGHLRIGFVGPAMAPFLAARIQALRIAWPGVVLDLMEKGTLRQIELLEAGELDLGVIRWTDNTAPQPGLHTRHAHTEPYVAALPADHPLAEKESVALEDFADVPLVFFSRRNGPALHDLLIAACHAAGFVPRIVQEAEKKWATLALVGAGVGAAFVPESSALAAMPGVIFRPLAQGRAALPPVTLCYMWHGENRNPVLDNTLKSFTGEGRSQTGRKKG